MNYDTKIILYSEFHFILTKRTTSQSILNENAIHENFGENILEMQIIFSLFILRQLFLNRLWI